MLIELQDVSITYEEGTPFEVHALKNINLSISKGEFLAIIGHTGSGKSTLVTLFNGLMMANRGHVFVNGKDLKDKNIKLSEVRRQVGLVFQYPEHQLFEETVEKDIAFAVTNRGVSLEEARPLVKKVMEMVDLDYEKYKDKSPIGLSGGEKRRVAIAGVLIMEPEVLVLDEPTAGLDPLGRKQILNQIKSLHDDYGLTVVLVSHSMDEVAKYVKRIVAMANGEIAIDGTTNEVFHQVEKLREIGLDIPQITDLMTIVRSKGLNVRTDIYNINEAVAELSRALKEGSDA